jgi:hypothetical protein
MTTWIIQNLTMLILNMVLNFTFVFKPKNYKCDSSNYAPIHAFTQMAIFTQYVSIKNATNMI